MSEDFNPRDHLRKIRGGADYLDVKYRVKWFRDKHPEGQIDTEHIELTDKIAIFRATVSFHRDNGDGRALASGYGSETPGDFGDYIEKAECVPLTVRALTRNGWAFYHQLRHGDEILGYNRNSKILGWTEVLDVRTFNDQPLVEIGNSRFTAVATPNHRWMTSRGLLPWNEIPGKPSATITLAAPMGERGGATRSAASLGWIVTDGNLRDTNGLPTRATITQSKEENFRELTDLFGEPTSANNALVREWPGSRVASPVRPAMLWSIGSDRLRAVLGWFRIASLADLPRAVLSMTYDEADAFLSAAMRADGSGSVFAKTHRPVVEAVQLAMFLTGHCTGPIQERAGNEMTTKPCYTVAQHSNGHKYLSEFTERRLPPQPVWCPTTTLDTWVADFNGRLAITGNTKAIGRALAHLGFGTQFIEPDGDAIDDTPVARPAPQSAIKPAPRTNHIPTTAPMLTGGQVIAEYREKIDAAPTYDDLYTIGEEMTSAGINDDGLKAAYRTKKAAFQTTA